MHKARIVQRSQIFFGNIKGPPQRFGKIRDPNAMAGGVPVLFIESHIKRVIHITHGHSFPDFPFGTESNAGNAEP